MLFYILLLCLFFVQVLRKEKFDGQCLIRRSDPESEAEHFDERVELWTNHRVMEWLRLVDLAEYAPNLRGSGTFEIFGCYRFVVLLAFIIIYYHFNLTLIY